MAETDNNEGPPPAYDEATASVPTGTAAESHAVPAGDQEQSAEKEEGTGVLASSSSRALPFGIALGLYFVLALSHPIYYLRATAQPCEWSCNNRASGSGGSGIGWGTGSSATGAYDWSYWGVRRRLQLIGDEGASGTYDFSQLASAFGGGGGCLESTVVGCDDFCEQYCDLCNDVDVCQDSYDLLYEGQFIASSRDIRLACWSLLVLGLFSGLIGVTLVCVAVLCKRGSLQKIGAVFVAVCAVLVGAGAITFTASWNEFIEFEELHAAWQLLILMEYLLPVAITGLFAADLFTGFLKSKRMRVYCLSGPFAFAGLWCGLLLAYIVNYDYAPGYDYPLADVAGCMSAGYFLVAIFSIARILIWTEVVPLDPIKGIVIRFVVAILFVIGGFILAVGYWAFVAAVFDCDTIPFTTIEVCENASHYYALNGDVTQGSQGASGDDYMPGKGHWSAYYMGYSLFFILPLTLINAYDMDIIGLFKKVKLAQELASHAP